jgi:N-acetyl sugar amidotransferase
VRWCARCVLPDSRPNLEILEDGVCNACHAHETKRTIDWEARRAAFADVVARVRALDRPYDCLIPVSGGKDSTWQVVACLEAGLHPLAVTWKTPGRTEIGAANLANLVSLGVDHIDYQVNPRVEARFMVETLRRYGDSGLPMHMALFNIPLSIAVRFGIPLVVWGENSAFEYGGADDERTGFRLDERWLRTYGVMHGTTADDWVGEALSARDLTPYRGPTAAELDAAGVLAIFLGYYLGWDPEATMRVARDNGFRSRPEGPKTGLYDYADIDDDFISIHHHLKWVKFGFTRLFDNLSLEIRNGRITRDEAIERIRATGDQTPHADIERFCSFAGMSLADFDELVEAWRNPEVWVRDRGVWRIEDFLVDDWEWR